jgi:cytochrome c oxidase subunit 2
MLSWLPESASSYGPTIDRLFYIIYYVTGVTFFIVQLTLLAFVIIYRQRDGRRARYTHGNTALEIAWTIAPAVLLVVLAFASRSVWAKIKYEVPPTNVAVWITAKQFNWEITYPGPDGKLGTDDDVTEDNDLHVPANKVIRLTLRSRDVIHSFFIPSLRFKQDLVPGHEIPAWFDTTHPGKFEIPCAELCGFGHSGMRGWLYAHTPEEFETWNQEKKAFPANLRAPS